MSKVFKLYIRTENVAFADDEERRGRYFGAPTSEIVRILREVADKIDKRGLHTTYQTIFDVNGNTVGRYALKPEKEL